MKKGLKRFFSMLVMFLMTISLVAGCGDKEITSLTIKEGTLDYVYMQNSDVSGAFDNIRVIVKYNDDSKVEVGKNDLTISEFKSTTVGTFKVAIEYDGFKTEVSLKVTNSEDELYGIYGVQKPESIVLRDQAIAQQQNEENEFFERTDTYVVGDDNPYVFFPKITALDDNDNLISINAFKSVVNVYRKDGSNYVLLTDNVADYVTVDTMNQTYDFTEAAIGSTFKLEVRPYWLNEEQMLNVSNFTTTWEVEVVNGYNVTTAKELLIMTNYARDTDKQTLEMATTFLTNNGITPMDVSGVVLHNNLTITEGDFPASYFETVSGVKYIKDYVDLYSHKVATGQKFNFYGNYYTVDFSQMPKVNIKSGETSHGTAFRLTSDEGANVNTPNTAKSYIYNTAFIGNANRSEDAAKTAGISGLILLKAENHTTTVDNCLMRTFFLHLMADNRSKTALNIEHVKSYDSYQNSIFAWGGTINIHNSILKRAGGPLMILQHRDVEEYGSDDETNARIDSYAPVVNVTGEKTVLESFVTGNESWFAIMGASKTVTFLSALARVFNGTGKNYVKQVQDAEGNTINAMNLIAVTMAGGETFDAVVNGSNKALGSVSINDKVVVSKYADNMGALETGLSQVPLVQALVNATVLSTMYETISKDPAMAATLQGMGVTSGDTLGKNIINKTENREKYNQIVAAIEAITAQGVQNSWTPEQIQAAIDEQVFGTDPMAGLLYQLISTYDAQVSSSDNVKTAVQTIMGAAPVFQSQNNGFGFVYTDQEIDLEDEANLGALLNSFTLHSNSNDLFTGDYVGMYYLGLGITLGYYSTASN